MRRFMVSGYRAGHAQGRTTLPSNALTDASRTAGYRYVGDDMDSDTTPARYFRLSVLLLKCRCWKISLCRGVMSTSSG